MEKFYKVVNDSSNKIFVKVSDKLPDHNMPFYYKDGGYVYVTSMTFIAKDVIAQQFENCIDCRMEKNIMKETELELNKKVFNYIEISENEYNRAKDTLIDLKNSYKSAIMNL